MNARRGLQAVGAALVATAIMSSTPAAIAGTSATPQAKAAATSGATEVSARRVHRRYVARPYYPAPVYYARPYYYRPYPYAVPAPFFLGFGYLPYY